MLDVIEAIMADTNTLLYGLEAALRTDLSGLRVSVFHVKSSVFSPPSEVLSVVVKGRCLMEVSRVRVLLVRRYLQCIHASRNL